MAREIAPDGPTLKQVLVVDEAEAEAGQFDLGPLLEAEGAVAKLHEVHEPLRPNPADVLLMRFLLLFLLCARSPIP